MTHPRVDHRETLLALGGRERVGDHQGARAGSQDRAVGHPREEPQQVAGGGDETRR